ncbi:FluG domain-containing protein [Dactylonectria estremocensis]|uniref:FluG domain-containing protein n=1 Tax=Dactylonectria estremocensis TaxID=1079267 RepID=A0A9P9IMY6_9HYPO|nr:FluG domain-containing protein [Dactylonectria estremocensis]
MMRHDPQFATFHHTYLNEIANFDLQNAFLEEEKQSQLFRLFAHVSLTRDPRATADMVPDEVWANLPPDPEIVKLEEQRAELKQGNYQIDGHIDEEKIRQLTEEIRQKRAHRYLQVVRQYCEHYFYNHPTWDIERQARGEEEKYAEPVINVTIPERAGLAEIFCHQPDDWTEDQIFRRKIEAIDLMVALCDKRETVKQTEPLETEHKSLPSPDRFPLLLHAAQCPDCIGDERLSREERAFTYCRPTVINDHFDDQHLIRRERAEQSGERIRCEHPNHVQRVHGVTLRSAEQVKQRRLRRTRRRQMVKGKRQQ